MSRLRDAFARMKGRARPGLVAYVTAGDPDLARSREVVRGVVRGGADVVEIGVPFSDPIADGPAIQRATERALASGGGLEPTLALVRDVRAEVDAPVVLFTYVNPLLRFGLDRFVEAAADAGVDGVLLLDLPIEEAAPVHARLDANGIDQIFLVSPTTTRERLEEAARLGRGFLYAISRLGVTGARQSLSDAAEPLVRRIRDVTDLPIALGFGVSTAEQVRAVTGFADAAVVGSAIVDEVGRAAREGRDPAGAAEVFVRGLVGAAGPGGGSRI
ncbi:MAG: tryptophan synthase subunit alpha [Vicinamibacterales bacterium]